MMNLKKLKLFDKKNLYKIALFVIAVIVVCSWYKTGQLIASGEESFSIFNNRNLFSLDAIWEETGTGILNPTYLPRYTVNLGVTLLRTLHLPLWSIQALFFFSLISSGMFGMFALVNYLLKNKDRAYTQRAGIFAGLFYFFNLYTMSQVFGRFLYSGMTAWALLPLFLYFWVRWIQDQEKKYLLLFLIISQFFSLAFLQPAFIITLWTPLITFSIVQIFTLRKCFSALLKLILVSGIGVITWLITNIWWMLPYFSLGSDSLKTVQNGQANFDSLYGVSQYFPLSEVVFLRQSFLMGPQTYHGLYQNPWMIVLSLLVILIIVIGVVTFVKKNYLVALLILMALGFTISKGTNPPFGYKLFKLLFDSFYFLQSFRNPYEKFGIILVLVYSVFWGAGVAHIVSTQSKAYVKGVLGVLVFLLCCVLLPWPMWTKDVFGSGVSNTRVTVPSYYEQTNNYLNSLSSKGRVAVLPLLPGDSVRLDWPEGYYQGIEPSIFLFDKPTVSRALKVPYFEEKYYSFYSAFIEGKYDTYLDELNINNIILNNDVDAGFGGASSSAQIQTLLRKNKNIHFDKKIGNLLIYSYSRPSSLITVDNPHITVDYTKLSNTSYRVHILNAQSPFTLIFKETYSNYWTAYIDNRKITNHSLVYDYANKWFITKKGNFFVDIKFNVMK